MEIRGGWDKPFGQKNKRGLKNQLARARFKRGLGKTLRTAYPSRVRLFGKDEYRPLRESSNQFSHTIQNLPGYGEAHTMQGVPMIPAKPPSEDWDRTGYNANYLTRTAAQILAPAYFDG